MGKSRSATCVVAYLLSVRPDLDPDSALALVREARPLAEPNYGFMQQLRLYHDMGSPSSDDALARSPAYQRWLYQREVESARSVGQAPTVDRIRFEDEHPNEQEKDAEERRAMQGVKEEVRTGERVAVELRCKKCRRTLARSPFILPHVPAKFGSQASPPPAGLTITPHRGGGSSSSKGLTTSDSAADESGSPECAHHFIDPLSWMREELSRGKLEGKLECPNARCKTLVGKYAWHGMRCSCGGWEVPGISLAKGRVDEMRLRRHGTAVGIAAAEELTRIRRGPGVGGNL